MDHTDDKSTSRLVLEERNIKSWCNFLVAEAMGFGGQHLLGLEPVLTDEDEEAFKELDKKEQRKIINKTRSLILLNLPSRLQARVISFKDPSVMVNKAIEALLLNTASNRVNWFLKLILEVCPGGTENDVLEWITLKRSTYETLLGFKLKLGEDVLAVCVILGLPDEFLGYIRDYSTRKDISLHDIEVAVRSYFSSKPTGHKVKAKVFEYSSMKTDSAHSSVQSRVSNTDSDVKCSICKRRNHSAAECYLNPAGNDFKEDYAKQQWEKSQKFLTKEARTLLQEYFGRREKSLLTKRRRELTQDLAALKKEVNELEERKEKKQKQKKVSFSARIQRNNEISDTDSEYTFCCFLPYILFFASIFFFFCGQVIFAVPTAPVQSHVVVESNIAFVPLLNDVAGSRQSLFRQLFTVNCWSQTYQMDMFFPNENNTLESSYLTTQPSFMDYGIHKEAVSPTRLQLDLNRLGLFRTVKTLLKHIQARLSHSCVTVHHSASIARCYSSKHTDRHCWILDSGATSHMTGEKSLVSGHRQPKKTHRVSFGDGSILNVASKGVSNIGGMFIDDTLFVPGMEVNLISVSKVTRSGLFVTFHRNHALIKKGRKTMLTFRMNDGLYIHNPAIDTACSAQALPFKRSLTDMEVHRRMGHCSSKVLRQLLGRKVQLDEVCETCIKGKSTQTGWKNKMDYMNRILERVHADLIGPMRESITNEIYVVTNES